MWFGQDRRGNFWANLYCAGEWHHFGDIWYPPFISTLFLLTSQCICTFVFKESGRDISPARQLGEWPAHLEAFREWRWAVALQRHFWATCLASSLEAAIFTLGRDRRSEGQCLDVVIGLKQRAPVVLTAHFLAEVLACSWHKGTATFVSVANLWILNLIQQHSGGFQGLFPS